MMSRGSASLKGITISAHYALLDIEVDELIGFMLSLNYLQDSSAAIDLPILAEHTELDLDDLFDITEMLSLLRFVVVNKGDISMTDQGKAFIVADMEERRQIFATAMKENIPFTSKILNILQKERVISFTKLLNLIDAENLFKAEEFLTIFIKWGRYADVLGYDDYNKNIYHLETIE
jgi:NitT/TauT family transport system ATP-binding protein